MAKAVAIFCGFTARFMSNLVGKPENRFSYDKARMPHVRGMIKNKLDFPHYVIMEKTNVPTFLLMIRGLKCNRCREFGQLKLMH